MTNHYMPTSTSNNQSTIYKILETSEAGIKTKISTQKEPLVSTGPETR